MKKCIIVLAVIAVVLSSVPVFGATDAELNAIKQQMKQLEAKIKSLESESQGSGSVSQETIDSMVTKAMSEQEGVPEWLSNVFGFEAELSYTNKTVNDKKSADDYTHDEVEALITVYGKVNSETDLVVRLLSDFTQGENNEDKQVSMPLAYFDYHPQSVDRLPFLGTGIDMLAGVTPFYNPGTVDGTHIVGGRIPYPFYHPVTANIVFDGPDLDGFGGIFKNPINDDLNMFATAAGAWITNNDDRTVGPDTSLWGGQIGLTYLMPGMDDTYATMALGYFDYGNIESSATGTSNTMNAAGKYDSDYNVLVANGEINFPLCKDIPVLCNYPVTFFGEYANNMAASTTGDSAYLLGVSVGEIETIGSWQFVYNYRDIEKDATLDANGEGFADTTDVTGHTFEIAYKLAENISFTTGYLAGKQDVSTSQKHNYDELTFSVGFAF